MPVTEKKPRFLIIGGGAVVSEYYIPALMMLGYFEGSKIIDSSKESLAAIKARYPRATVTHIDYREYFSTVSNERKHDIAVIALPNRLHEEVCIKAIDFGLHVLCEKPLTLTVAGCKRLADYAKSKNCLLGVNMIRRFMPGVSILREALRTGMLGNLHKVDIELGDLYSWDTRTGTFFEVGYGGILADMGVHYLDLVEYLVGALKPVNYCDDWSGGVETECEYILTAAQDIPVRIKLSYRHKLRNSLIFIGEKGKLVLEKNAFNYCLWHPCESDTLKARVFMEKPFSVDRWPLKLESCFAEQFYRFACSCQNFSFEYAETQDALLSINLIEWAFQHRKISKGSSSKKKRESVCDKLLNGPVAVTGGTGFIGEHLVKRLYELGCKEISVPVRNNCTCISIGRFPVLLKPTNLLDYRQVKELVKGVRHVFHLAYGRDGHCAERSRVTIDGTKNIIEASINAGVESVVILSSMYVFGNHDKKCLINETFPYSPKGGEYGQSKAKMEKWCLKKARFSKKTRIVILTPTCVYGPGGKAYSEMPIKMAKEGRFCWIDEGKRN